MKHILGNMQIFTSTGHSFLTCILHLERYITLYRYFFLTELFCNIKIIRCLLDSSDTLMATTDPFILINQEINSKITNTWECE
jgi:hypothetical protein